MAQRWRWPKRPARALAALAFGAAVVTGTGRSGPTAGADPIGSCSGTAGVLVAVDLGHWGGPVERGCDASTTTAYDALHRAGFTTAGDDTDGPAFVCRIDDRPDPAEQSCQTTPPANAYWEFWYADAGAAGWTYAPLGAMSFRPAPGSIDAWVFTGTHTGPDGPTFTPAEIASGTVAPMAPPTTVRRSRPTTTTTPARATTTTTTPATTVPATSTTTVGAATTTTARSHHAPSTTTRPPTTTTLPPAATTTTAVPPATSSPTTALRIVAAGPAGHGSSGPSAVGLAVGAAVVAALAVAAGVVVRRRRVRP